MSQDFRIAKIIDSTTFVINAGIDQGIKEGDRFQIVGQKGEPVVDPITGEELGTLDSIKGTIVVTALYARMSIARSETYRIGGSLNNALSAIATPSINFNDLLGETRHKELSVDPNQITGGLASISEDSPIQIGDFLTFLSSQNQ